MKNGAAYVNFLQKLFVPPKVSSETPREQNHDLQHGHQRDWPDRLRGDAALIEQRSSDIEIVAANDLAPPGNIAQLLKYDILHGHLREQVAMDGGALRVGLRRIWLIKGILATGKGLSTIALVQKRSGQSLPGFT